MSYGQPPGGFGPPGGVTGGYPGVYAAPEEPKSYLWMNILGIFGCAVFGIIGLVFALQVSGKWQMGDYAGAQSASNTARVMGIVSFVCFILNAAFWIIYFGIFVLVFGVVWFETANSY